MKCLLHIGTEKTGTTLLQDWLYENQKQLSDQRVYLSSMLGKTNNRLFPAFFQNNLDDWAKYNNIKTRVQKNKFFDGFLDKLSLEIEAASKHHDLFIITSEHFHSRVRQRDELERIKKYLDDNFAETFVICYFRHQADMAVSLYSTALKVLATGKLDLFLSGIGPNDYYYNFKEIADNWASVFGKQFCIFKIYDKNKFSGGDLRIDFIQSLPSKVDASKLNYRTYSRNESLNRLNAVAYRKINEYVPYWNPASGGVSKLNDKLKTRISRLNCLKLGKIDSEKKRDIYNLFQKANAEFLHEYFPLSERLDARIDLASDEKTFTYAEVEEIIEGVLSSVLPYVTEEGLSRLLDSDADYLRDIAIKIEQRKELNLSDANKLMLLAHRARPNGPLIKTKIDEYSAKLNVDNCE